MKKIYLFSLVIIVFLLFSGCSEKYLSSSGGKVTRDRKSYTVTAVSDNGYRFVGWSDGERETTRAYDRNIEGEVTAIFEPISVILHDGDNERSLSLSLIAITDLSTLAPSSAEGIYRSGYFSDEVCGLLSLETAEDCLYQIQQKFLGEGITDVCDLELYSRYLEYSAGEGGGVSKTADGVSADADNGYRFVEWSDKSEEQTRNDDFTEPRAAFSAVFEPIEVELYVSEYHVSSFTLSDFVSLSKESLAAYKSGADFKGWTLKNGVLPLELSTKTDVVEQINAYYKKGAIRDIPNIELLAEFGEAQFDSFYDFKTISHALGGAPWLEKENTYFNSLEVFEYNYGIGHRFFEIDLLLTSDGKIVASHDYGSTVTYDEFMATKTEGFTPIDLEMFVDMMIEYRDIRMDLDILSIYRSGYVGSAEEKLTVFYDALDAEIKSRDSGDGAIYNDVYDRLVLEIFFETPYESLSMELAKREEYGFKHFMYAGVGDKEFPMGTELDELRALCEWCVENGVLMMSTKICDAEFIKMTDSYGIFTFAYTFNSPSEIYRLLSIGIDCVFTDFVYF